VNDDSANEFYHMSDLRGVPEGHADVPTLFITSNRGRVVQLFDNPHHSKVCIYACDTLAGSLCAQQSILCCAC
jgi:hypothetical protein